ncbi:RidA family protein [Natrinema longum]|uniref:RidA family protein n=1 Tax=Natrinema longum TaxID=370324 RepID=A0A8A2UA86_9EURY|nr:RidA family protein [Natrinema longum]MBZ6496598.1 RidA family protein [Natrinema longum]QSW85503.1 RidA family protein [Natrinema longum]
MGHDRIDPEGIADPVDDLYSQVVVSSGEKTIHVAGTTARDSDGLVVGETYAEQIEQTLTNVEASLAAAGADPADVVRQTIYALDCDAFVEEAYPHVVDFYGDDALPASALIGADSLADPDYLLELEVTAVLEE